MLDALFMIPFRIASRGLPLCARVMEWYLEARENDTMLERRLPRGGMVTVTVWGKRRREGRWLLEDLEGEALPLAVAPEEMN